MHEAAVANTKPVAIVNRISEAENPPRSSGVTANPPANDHTGPLHRRKADGPQDTLRPSLLADASVILLPHRCGDGDRARRSILGSGDEDERAAGRETDEWSGHARLVPTSHSSPPRSCARPVREGARRADRVDERFRITDAATVYARAIASTADSIPAGFGSTMSAGSPFSVVDCAASIPGSTTSSSVASAKLNDPMSPRKTAAAPRARPAGAFVRAPATAVISSTPL